MHIASLYVRVRRVNPLLLILLDFPFSGPVCMKTTHRPSMDEVKMDEPGAS